MATTQHASQRLVTRASTEVIELVQDAADISGVSVSDFLRECVIQRARAVISAHEEFTLSARGQEQIMQALENPSPINSKLRNAARRLKEHGGFYST
uniref:type II toxin-antitoxin system TacA family antitoxin n=1 Tax=Marinobacterium profundum TaxID=1714300 RepID=UPI000A62F5A8